MLYNKKLCMKRILFIGYIKHFVFLKGQGNVKVRQISIILDKQIKD